jgi:hypothetical protein
MSEERNHSPRFIAFMAGRETSGKEFVARMNRQPGSFARMFYLNYLVQESSSPSLMGRNC